KVPSTWKSASGLPFTVTCLPLLGATSCTLATFVHAIETLLGDSALEHVGADELGPLDADALQRPAICRCDNFGTLVADEEGVATEGGAGAGVPGDGPVGPEQVRRLRRQRQLDQAAAGQMTLRTLEPLVLEAADEVDAPADQQDLA